MNNQLTIINFGRNHTIKCYKFFKSYNNGSVAEITAEEFDNLLARWKAKFSK